MHEVLVTTGNITSDDNNETIVHCHISLGDNNYQVFGGHLKEATVAITAEIFITVFENINIKRKTITKNLKLLDW